jgi:hypothetical protein
MTKQVDSDYLKKGRVVIEWVELGEGFSGDYDPDDPNDEELLRFDAYINNHEWEDDYPTYSYCTYFPVSATPEQRRAGLEYLMEHLYEPMSKREWCRSEAERLSWIELDWIKENVK